MNVGNLTLGWCMHRAVRIFGCAAILMAVVVASHAAAADGLPPVAGAAAATPAVAPTEVKIDFAEPERESDDGGAFPYAPPIEQIFQNPAIATSLASGADALNRSVESLMDALFYSLLDTEKNFYFTPHIWLGATLKRDVYSTPSGAYVMVDRMVLGPRYAKELWRVHGIPVALGVDGSVEAMQIYLRTDGMRLAEQDELSPLRRLANNWFGLLPLAALVLPPSFNQNELYDPITQLQTPFSFPLGVDGFYSMPEGSIRSYAISGGVRLSADIGGLLDQSSKDFLDRVGGLEEAVPYTVFRTGEHRINVLRRSQHSAWVGVTDLKRVGHSLNPLVGRKYFVLRGALAARIFDLRWIWAGVPFAVLPIDLNFEQALADSFDQVYEFDLQIPAAREAYAAAVRGDFVPAKQRYLDAKEKGLVSGVLFHFARTQEANESVSRNGPNLAVFRNERKRDHGEAEIEITDPDGKFYILEASQDVADKQWDILVGEEEDRVQQTVQMRVRRVVSKEQPDDPQACEYAFDAGENPFDLVMNLTIQDRYLNTREYYDYLDRLRYFTALPLENVPTIEVRDSEMVEERRRAVFLDEPTAEPLAIHVTPTYLGRFGAQASIYFSADELDRIAATPEDDMWAAFAQAFALDETRWRDPVIRNSFGHQLAWFHALAIYPLRLINLRSPAADAIKEGTNAIRQLQRLRSAVTPAAKLEAFHDLLDSDHPRQLARALLLMADLKHVPRRVSFSAQPKGKARHEIRDAYGKLNTRVFRSGPPFPEPGRYARAKKKLANFYLDQPREAKDRPHVVQIKVQTKEVAASALSLEQSLPVAPQATAQHVYITFSVDGVAADKALKLYVRVEQAGRVKIGKLELAEKVLALSPLQEEAGRQTYALFLTGPTSPLSNYLLDQSVGSGDDFLVTLAVSGDGVVWSDERALECRFFGGRLMPADADSK